MTFKTHTHCYFPVIFQKTVDILPMPFNIRCTVVRELIIPFALINCIYIPCKFEQNLCKEWIRTGWVMRGIICNMARQQ